MSDTTAITTTGVTFSKQKNGYDRDQVDRYINMLVGAYQSAYEQHEANNEKYNKLREDYSELEKELERIRTGTTALTKALIDAENMAEKIIADARLEAEKIKGDAYIEKIAAKRSMEVAGETIAQTIFKLQKLTVSHQ